MRSLVAILLAGLVACLSCGEAAAQGETEPGTSAFRLLPSVEVSLDMPGLPPIVYTHSDRLDEIIRSSSDSEGSSNTKSVARGIAEVEVVEEKPRAIAVKLRARSRALGLGEATSTAKARLELTVPPELRDIPVMLRLVADRPGDVSIRVVRPDGEAVPVERDVAGSYMLSSIGRTKVTIEAQVSADDVSNDNTEAKLVNLRAFIEQGPIMPGTLKFYIWNGEETEQFTNVGAVTIDGKLHCTATLVASRTLLTAAHCVAGYEGDISAGRFAFALGRTSATPTRIYRIEAGRYPREPALGFQYSPGDNYRDDIAVLYLASAASEAPASIHQGAPAWSVLQQLNLQFVGYGYNGSVAGSAGVKRQANWPIQTLEARSFSWDASNASTCVYDSGGPAFDTANGLLVGVTSMGKRDCTFGVETRVDAFWPWLDGKLR